MKIGCAEPAERPYTVALSGAEVVALVKYHVGQSKRITRVFGQEAMKDRAERGLFGNASKLNALAKLSRTLLNAHMDRAKGLAAILEEAE